MQGRGLRAGLGALAITAACATASPAAVQVSRSGWAWGNPTPQGNDVRALDFVAGRGYAAGLAGTALRTDDAGATWTGLATGTSADVARLQVIDNDTLLIGGGDGCMLRRSDDAGATFRRLFIVAEADCPDRVEAFFFVDEQVGYLLLRDGSVLRTADAGETFSKQTAIPGTPAATGGGRHAATEITFTSRDTGFVFVRTGERGSALFTTTDAGVSWRPNESVPPATVRRVTMLDAANGYAVGPDTLLRTADGGATWERRPIGDGEDLTSIRCATVDTCLLTTVRGDRFLRTTDGGATKTPVTASTSAIFAVAFATAQRVVAAGAGGATVVSDDGGVNYTPVGGDIGGTYFRLRASSPTTAYAIGARGQLARTTDGGASWRTISVSTSSDVADVSFPTVESGYALDVRGGLFKTGNGGASWQTLDPGTKRATRVVALGDGTVLLAGFDGLRRSQGGGRFDPIGSRALRRATLTSLDANRGSVFAFGGRAIVASTNAGRAWRRLRLPRGGRTRIRSVDFVSAQRGWVLEGNGRLWTTGNGGRSWRDLPGVGSAEGGSLSFGSAAEGFLTLSRFPGDPAHAYVLRTSDGGRTWRPQLISTGYVPSGGLVAATGRAAFALVGVFGSDGSGVQRRLFATATGGDAGRPSTLALATRRTRLSRRTLRRAGYRVRVTGTLAGAEGGERVVVSRRAAGGSRWTHQVVTAGANGGSFTTTWRMRSSSVFVARWAGDSGRTGAGTRPLAVRVTR